MAHAAWHQLQAGTGQRQGDTLGLNCAGAALGEHQLVAGVIVGGRLAIIGPPPPLSTIAKGMSVASRESTDGVGAVIMRPFFDVAVAIASSWWHVRVGLRGGAGPMRRTFAAMTDAQPVPDISLRGRRLLGIDYGRVRIGIAVVDPLGIAPRAVGFIPRESDAAAAVVVARLATDERAEGIVIGLPVNADGSQGANVRWVRAFAAELRKASPLPIAEVDERYSSAEAEEALRELGRWPPKHKGQVDAMSAALLLRRYCAGER